MDINVLKSTPHDLNNNNENNNTSIKCWLRLLLNVLPLYFSESPAPAFFCPSCMQYFLSYLAFTSTSVQHAEASSGPHYHL